ncbi:MAG: hypothetical protein JXA60_04735 [Candidatus Coatesbacteria bacterium]|nr:hypothetical protein [Candidatus Coatesbacteria bacterium]
MKAKWIYPLIMIVFMTSCYENSTTDTGIPPGNITLNNATDIKAREAKLTWTKSKGGGFQNYQLYRGNSSGIDIDNDLVGIFFDRDTTEFIDSNLYPETKYYYKMLVSDGIGNTVWSNEISLTTAKDDSGGNDYTSIYEIQFTEDSSGDSPLKDQVVTTTGIVTANFSDVSGHQYIFIGEKPGGPWRGLCIFSRNASEYDCAEGDSIVVKGQVQEFNNFTEMSNIEEFTVIEQGHSIPFSQVTTGQINASSSDAEKYESVLVTTGQVTVVNPDMGYGEFSISDGSGETIVNDYFQFSYTPVKDDVLNYVRGVVDYSYSAYKIEPRSDDDIGK